MRPGTSGEENQTMTEQKTTRSLMIGRRRLLTLTAAGVSVAAFGGLGGVRSAFAADTVRWVSPRGTVEVLDDYPYWVGKKFGYFGDIETTLEPGPSDATATVKLVDQNQADVGYPSPGVFSLGLAQGIPLVSVFEMGGADVFDFAFRKGEAPADIKGLEGKTIVLGSAGWQSIADPMLKAAGVDITKVKYVDAGWPTWGTAVNAGQGRYRAFLGGAARPVEGPGPRFRLHPRPQLLEAPGQQLRHPQGGFRRRGEAGGLCPLPQGLGRRPRIRPPNPRAATQIVMEQFPGLSSQMNPTVATESHDAARQRLRRPLGRAEEVGLPHHGELAALLRYRPRDRPDHRRLQDSRTWSRTILSMRPTASTPQR